MSAQAVGGAIGHNPISIIIPCHRVVGSDGCITGYAGGIDKKLNYLKLKEHIKIISTFQNIRADIKLDTCLFNLYIF